MPNHLHLAGYFVAIALAAAAGGIGLVLHEIFHSSAQQDRRVDSTDNNLTTDREVNQS